MKYNLLIVDDEQDNIDLILRTFRSKYNYFTANSGEEALDIIKSNRIDLIISDHNMPNMNGLEFLNKSIELSHDSLKILITAYADSNMLVEAINNGKIYRCVLKPWEPEDLLKITDEALSTYKMNLENNTLANDFRNLFSGTISAITEALDAKDSYTYGRSQRVTENSMKLAKYFNFDDFELTRLEIAGLLHDIGMIGVPEVILKKIDKLTSDEYEIIKNHVDYGVKIIKNIKQLEPIVDIVLSHHERYDGKGYPNGIKGDAIPLSAGIIAVTDAYDGMVSKRAYRDELSHEEALQEVKKASGTQFSPEIVEAFIEVMKDN